MLKSVNCIQTGQVLIDENLHSFILCNNCHTEYLSVHSFHEHLKKCNRYDKLFKSNLHINYNNNGMHRQLLGKSGRIIKEYLIYDFRDIELILSKSTAIRKKDSYLDLLNNIEEELLDPRWYTDDENHNTNKTNPNVTEVNTMPKTTATTTMSTTTITSSVASKLAVKRNIQYDKLVEAVTPYVQFKENVKTRRKCHDVLITHRRKLTGVKAPEAPPLSSLPQTDQTDQITNDKKQGSSKSITNGNLTVILKGKTPLHKQRIQQQNHTPNIKHPTNSSKSLIKRQKLDKGQKEIPLRSALLKVKAETDKKHFRQSHAINETSQSLSQSLSVPLQLPLPANKEKQTAQILSKLQTLGLQIKRTQAQVNKTDNKTLELLQKLQSKGMKIRIVKQTSTSSIGSKKATLDSLSSTMPNESIEMNSPIKVCSSTPIDAVLPVNKNLIIRKLH